MNEEDASFTHPSSRITEWDGVDKSGSWCNASKVNVQYLGITDKQKLEIQKEFELENELELEV